MDRVWREEYSETVSGVWAVPESFSCYRCSRLKVTWVTAASVPLVKICRFYMSLIGDGSSESNRLVSRQISRL